MNDRLGADKDVITAVSRTLHTAADDLGEDLPPPPDLRAGRLTATFLGSATHLVDEAKKLAGQLGGASGAVVSARDQYLRVDEASEEALRPIEEKHREYEQHRREMERQGLDPDEPV